MKNLNPKNVNPLTLSTELHIDDSSEGHDPELVENYDINTNWDNFIASHPDKNNDAYKLSFIAHALGISSLYGNIVDKEYKENFKTPNLGRTPLPTRKNRENALKKAATDGVIRTLNEIFNYVKFPEQKKTTFKKGGSLDKLFSNLAENRRSLPKMGESIHPAIMGQLTPFFDSSWNYFKNSISKQNVTTRQSFGKELLKYKDNPNGLDDLIISLNNTQLKKQNSNLTIAFNETKEPKLLKDFFYNLLADILHITLKNDQDITLERNSLGRMASLNIDSPVSLLANTRLDNNSQKREGRNKENRKISKTLEYQRQFIYENNNNIPGLARESITTKEGRNDLILNLATYQKILTLIQQYKSEYDDISDKKIAEWIRENIKGEFFAKNKNLPEEVKELIVDLTTLLFICENERNPAIFITNNMLLDLISNNIIGWDTALCSENYADSQVKNKKTVAYNHGLMPMSPKEIVASARGLQDLYNPYMPRHYTYPGNQESKKIDKIVGLEAELVNKWLDFQQNKNENLAEIRQNPNPQSLYNFISEYFKEILVPKKENNEILDLSFELPERSKTPTIPRRKTNLTSFQTPTTPTF